MEWLSPPRRRGDGKRAVLRLFVLYISLPSTYVLWCEGKRGGQGVRVRGTSLVSVRIGPVQAVDGNLPRLDEAFQGGFFGKR